MGKDQEKKMVGVCRIIDYPDGNQAEFALAISDEWQSKGIGAAMLTACLKAAKEFALSFILVRTKNVVTFKSASD